MSDDKIICYCNGISLAEIKEAINNGAKTLEDIQEATGAGTICGQCNEEIEEILG